MYTPGITLTSTGTAVASPLPLDASNTFPRRVLLTATAACYVKVSLWGDAAVAGDLLITPQDSIELNVSGLISISVLSVSGTASLNVVPDDSGVWGVPFPKTLDLSFVTTQTLDSRITFTRASSGTHFDSTGRLVTDGNNVARFDYDPVTLLPRGLLIEEQRTNLLLHSRDMTQAAWSKTDVTAARTQVGIDGVASSACLMTEGSAGTATCFQAGTVAAGSTITVSYVLKRGNNDWIRIAATDGVADGANAWFNLNTGAKGTVTAVGAGTNNSSTITSLGGGWYRVTVTTTPNGTYTSARAQFRSASSDGGGVVANATYIVDCAQLEVGAFATSPIITGAATATRAADSASMTGTNFSSWFNASAGTFVAEALTSASGSRGVFSINDGTSNNKSDIRIGTGAANFCTVGGVSQTSIGVGISAGAVHKIAHALDASNRYVCVDGAAVASAASLIPSVTALQIGGFDVGTSFQLNGHLRSLRYYNTRLPNANLQSLTA